MSQEIPITPPPSPIICKPYDEPLDHWLYREGVAERGGYRRNAGYFYKTEKTGSAQQTLFAEENWDSLPLVNKIREDVKRWREADYRGASGITRELLRHWAKKDRARRLFFCQREAVGSVPSAALNLIMRNCGFWRGKWRGKR